MLLKLNETLFDVFLHVKMKCIKILLMCMEIRSSIRSFCSPNIPKEYQACNPSVYIQNRRWLLYRSFQFLIRRIFSYHHRKKTYYARLFYCKQHKLLIIFFIFQHMIRCAFFNHITTNSSYSCARS